MSVHEFAPESLTWVIFLTELTFEFWCETNQGPGAYEVMVFWSDSDVQPDISTGKLNTGAIISIV